MLYRLILLALTLSLGGCDLATLMADPKVAQREAEAQAIGGACRYGLRSIEDCYILNERASKAAIYTGWKEMDQYMRENKAEGIVSKLTPNVPAEEVIDSTKSTKPAAQEPTEKSDSTSKTSSKTKAAESAADKAAAAHAH